MNLNFAKQTKSRKRFSRKPFNKNYSCGKYLWVLYSLKRASFPPYTTNIPVKTSLMLLYFHETFRNVF